MQARLMTSNQSFSALIYPLDMLQMYMCMSDTYTPNLVCVHFGMYCMTTVSQGKQYKFYEHVPVLRHDSPHDTKNCAKEFLTVKLKPIDATESS